VGICGVRRGVLQVVYTQPLDICYDFAAVFNLISDYPLWGRGAHIGVDDSNHISHHFQCSDLSQTEGRTDRWNWSTERWHYALSAFAAKNREKGSYEGWELKRCEYLEGETSTRLHDTEFNKTLDQIDLQEK